MTKFNSFEEMDVWQESRELVRAIRSICKRPQVKQDYTFVDQITRSVRSVSANIAEGCESMTVALFINSLGIAKRECGEVRSHLYDARDEEYISKEEFDRLADLTKKIGSMIARLIHHLQSVKQNYKRTYAKSNNDSTSQRVNE